MNLAFIFQISIYSLTALAGLMLAYGEETPFPSTVTIFASIVAFLFNERTRRIRIGLLWSNVLGLAALGLAVFEFFGESLEARLLAGAHFLVYLTWLVLFQEKRTRQYWWLFALGLLQVAVGSVLTSNGVYGMLLVTYLLLALWTMAVFHLYQGALEFGAPGVGPALASPSDEVDRIVQEGSVEGARPTSDGSTMTPLSHTTVRDAIQQDAPDRWITPRFVGGVLSISVLGLVMGLLMFLLTPRIWLGGGNPFGNRADGARRALTGFSNEVHLGHMGKILESNQKVMQVRLFDQATDAAVNLEEFAALHGLEEPLFRGGVLEVYKAGEGKWSSPGAEGRLGNLPSWPRRDGMIRQEYELEPLGSSVLFSMRPVFLGKIDPYDIIAFDTETRVLVSRSEVREPLTYYIYSVPYKSQGPRAAGRRPNGPFGDLPPFLGGGQGQFQRAKYLNLAPDGLERLKSLAAEWTSPERAPPRQGTSEERRLALAIESRLRDSGEFAYSLNMTRIDLDADPVEDFLFNRKKGHCEYYASALALMLRAVNVPSRLVTGFKGAEFFPSGGYYEVHQRHAHAWVEAYVDNEWIVLDATPSARDDSVKSFGGNDGFFGSAKNSLSTWWSTYVINMSRSRQQESFYDPISGGFSTVRGALAGAQNAARWVKDKVSDPEQLLSGPGAAFALGSLALLVVTFSLLHRSWGWVTRGDRGVRAPSRWRLWLSVWLGRLWGRAPGQRMIIRFYEQFLALVSQRGLFPEEHQTQREFARQVEQALAGSLGSDGLAALPRDVTDLFYRVRFGGADLPPSEIADMDTRLRRFAERLRPGK